jgi:hypothetical protein
VGFAGGWPGTRRTGSGSRGAVVFLSAFPIADSLCLLGCAGSLLSVGQTKGIPFSLANAGHDTIGRTCAPLKVLLEASRIVLVTVTCDMETDVSLPSSLLRAFFRLGRAHVPNFFLFTNPRLWGRRARRLKDRKILKKKKTATASRGGKGGYLYRKRYGVITPRPFISCGVVIA